MYHYTPAHPPRIRMATTLDAEAVLAIYAPIVRDTAISFESDVPDVDEMQRRIDTITATHPWLVFEEQGHVLGYAYASTHRTRAAYRWTAEVTVYVAESARERHVGRRLYSALLEVLRRLSYGTAVAGITLPNIASVALHESLGFVPVGVFRSVGYKSGAWHDVGWWQLQLLPYESQPAEPETMHHFDSAPERLRDILSAAAVAPSD